MKSVVRPGEYIVICVTTDIHQFRRLAFVHCVDDSSIIVAEDMSPNGLAVIYCTGNSPKDGSYIYSYVGNPAGSVSRLEDALGNQIKVSKFIED